jgi:hypothetical protein
LSRGENKLVGILTRSDLIRAHRRRLVEQETETVTWRLSRSLRGGNKNPKLVDLAPERR